MFSKVDYIVVYHQKLKNYKENINLFDDSPQLLPANAAN